MSHAFHSQTAPARFRLCGLGGIHVDGLGGMGGRSARLHAAIVERRLILPDDRELARHASEAIARHSRRGWRIDKPTRAPTSTPVIALAMDVERAEHRPEPVELIGWL